VTCTYDLEVAAARYLDALAGGDVPLGVLPCGTGNLLAVNLGVPRDMDGAIQVALSGGRRRIDVGVIDGAKFLVATGLGFDAAMLRDADPELKQRIGTLAYVASGLRQVRRHPTSFEISLDGRPPVTRRGQGLLVANVGQLQGGILLFPDARATDGVLDVGVLKTTRLRDWLGLVVRMVLLHRPVAPQLETFRARRVEVRCDRPQPAERDGEYLAPTDRLAAEILPRALTVCVPDHEEGRR
jgi:diacylglycerol kinase family enzyme